MIKIIDGRKQCSKCKKWKELELFHIDSHSSVGRRSNCAACSALRDRSIKRKIYEKEYYKANKERVVEYRNQWRQANRLACIEKHGGKCVKCGFSDVRALQFDHINGKDTSIKYSRDQAHKEIFENKMGEYQLLCANCNWIKRYENKEWSPRGAKTH